MDLRERCHQAERMDEPDVPVAEMATALGELDGINTWLGGLGASLALLRHRMRELEGPVRLLDIGAGSGGTARFLRRWATRQDIDLEVTLVDIHTAVCRVAADRADDDPRLRIVQANAFDLPFADGAFDFAHSALFLHHFGDEAIVRLLGEMRRVAARGVVINDLHRHPVAYHSIRAIGRLFIRSPIVRHDAPLSVRRGFRAAELDAWRQALPRLGYRRRWPFRWTAWSFTDGGTPRRPLKHV